MSNKINHRLSRLTVILAANEWLIYSCAFSFILLLVRLAVTQKPEYIFLPWNLFLAYIPYRLTEWMVSKITLLESKGKLLSLLLLWLVFIPNAFYIITDLFHIAKMRAAPKWFDLLLVFSFAWNGILLGVLSLRRVETIVHINMGRRFTFLLVLLVMWLIALGIYIGRFLRFNSWDIITDPFSLMQELADMVFHPFEHGYAWGMTVCYAVFMTLLYFTIRKTGRA